MYKPILILCFAFLSCSANKQMQTNAQPSLDSVFVSWNKLTFESLNRQAETTSDSLQKAAYKNRLLSVKEYWSVKNIDDLNNNSIRYKFLKTIFANPDNNKKDFYIIEANESGSKVLLRTFVLNKEVTNTIGIEFYEFYNEEWHKTGKFKESNLHIQPDFKNYLSKFGKGFNYDDVVLTEFKNGQVKDSEYYLYTTLAADSNFKRILDGYRKENFIK